MIPRPEVTTDPQSKKVERYDWAKPGDRGEARSVEITELMIDRAKDGGYQRDEISETNTLNIARAFSWALFGTLIVFERPNGKKYVVDGQQRLSAARRRGDISYVPCRVFKSDGREHEARAFVQINCNRKPVRAVAKFLANCRAGVHPEVDIQKALADLELVVGDNGQSEHVIDFPASLLDTWKDDPDQALEALKYQRLIVGHEPMASAIHRGIVWLLRRNVHLEEYVRKLQECGGKTAILRAIRTRQIESLNKGLTSRVCGIGILDLINYKRKRKIIPELDEDT